MKLKSEPFHKIKSGSKTKADAETSGTASTKHETKSFGGRQCAGERNGGISAFFAVWGAIGRGGKPCTERAGICLRGNSFR